jgi:hypothetical protein
MRYIIAATMCILFFNTENFAQQKFQAEKKQMAIVPSEIIFLSVASQKDCPLQIEDAKYLLDTNADYKHKIQFEVRNISSKPIEDFNIVAVRSSGTINSILHPWRSANSLLMPQSKTECYKKNLPYEIVPFPKELNQRLQLKGKVRGIVILLVQEVLFADGSRYKDEGSVEALSKYFEELDNLK